jgi:hypothetical protein
MLPISGLDELVSRRRSAEFESYSLQGTDEFMLHS